MAADSLRSKSLACLREGRVTVRTAMTPAGSAVPTEVEATVRSSREPGPTYHVDLIGGRWSCVCMGRVRENRCAHLSAVQLVTGHAMTRRAVEQEVAW